MTDRWYAIQIMPQYRETAEFHLSKQNFEAFFPQLRIRLTKLKERIEPLFKGYAFVRFDPLQTPSWRSINGTYGVVGLLPRHKLIPQPMRLGLVEHLIKVNPITEDQFLDFFDTFFPGTPVEVKTGLMQGRRATVVNVRAKLVEISFLYQFSPSNTIWMDKSALIPVEDEV